MIQSKTNNIPRRNAIKAGLVRVVTLAVGSSFLPLKANPNVQTRTENSMALDTLINTLRAMENDVCDTAAKDIETSLDSGSALFLHLRNAGLNVSDILNLGEALSNLSDSDNKPLLSFSMSYNSQVGDAGAVALAQSLPLTLQEIGFVNCNIRDEGGDALLQWAKQAPNLKMICIESNLLGTELQSLFRVFNQDNPDVTVIL